jgi:hypothetical protein
MPLNSFGNHDRYSNDKRGKALRIVGHVFVGLIFAVAFALVFGLLVKLIWNSLMPSIFSLKEITYWQAFGIVILAKLLFGGFGSRAHDHWKRDRSDHFYWHKPVRGSDEEKPPRRYDRNWKTYTRYWNEEGKAAFDAYVDRVEKRNDVDGEAGRQQP